MTQLLENALYGTALILAAALLRRVLKGRFLPGARLCLWAACLFRLLTPIAPASVLSLWGLLAKPAPAPAQTPQIYTPAPAITAPAAQPQPQPDGVPWALVLGGAWLAVGLVLAARYVLSWRRTRRAVRCAIPLDRDDPRYLPLPKFARLREGVMEGAPLTFGAVRPTVVLLPGLGGEELECVLAHEGVHAARRDNLWHYAMALALVVHWWNPAVWLMSRLLRRDIELACDRAAVKKLGWDKRGQYARALVSLATQGEGPAFSHTFGRKLTEERILSIMKFKKTTIFGAVLSLALVAVVTVALASSPKQPDPPPAATPAQLDSAGTATPVEITGRELPDGAWEKAYALLDRVYNEEFNGAPAASAPPSACPHLHVMNAGVFNIAESISDTAHTRLTVNVKWCLDCEDAVVASKERVEEPHRYSFEQGSYLETDHSAADPGKHAFVFSHTCEDCSSSYRYTVAAGCTVDGCVDIQSVADKTGEPVRNADGTYALCDRMVCPVPYDHCHVDGKVVRVYYENPGLLCARDSCNIEDPHTHDGVQFVGKAPKAYVILHPELAPVPSAAP